MQEKIVHLLWLEITNGARAPWSLLFSLKLKKVLQRLEKN
jgi:hypothetical protein